MRMIGLAMLLACAAWAWGAETPAGLQGREARVHAILQNMTTPSPEAQAAVEQQLVAEGPAAVPVLERALTAQQAALAAAEARAADGEIVLAQRRINALDGALARLTWGFSPRDALAQWLGGLTLRDGTPFTRPPDPASLTDAALARVFPGCRFFVVYYPPYRGGAAPSEMILRHYQVPPQLARLTLFAVGRDRAVRAMPDAEALTAFARAALPAVSAPAAADAARAYLRLGTAFFRWNDQPLPFTLAGTPAVTREGDGWRAAATATAAPTHGNSGTLTATLTFDAAGALRTAALTPELRLSLEPLRLVQ